MKMKTGRKLLLLAGVILAVCIVTVQQFPAVASAAEYEALKGVTSAKAVFDVRTGQPESAVNHLKLIRETYKELKEANKKPVFVVVFIGPSVRLISSNTAGFKSEDVQTLHEIARTISTMSKEGIKLEICLVAAKVFHVDPATVLPEIERVPNGWIALIGYEARGYALIPAY